jgi:bifunctional non-homologous end joining protein LigD
MVRIAAGSAKLVTRGGHDWTDRMSKLAGELDSLPVESAWLDGEVVALTESG